MDIREKIKLFADGKFSSITEFAQATDTSRTTIYQYFNGEIAPGQKFFSRLYDLGCDLNWLFANNGAYKFSEERVAYGEDRYKEVNERLKKAERTLAKIEGLLKEYNKQEGK